MSTKTARSNGTGLPTMSRYDLLLALLPVPLLCGALVALTTPLSEAVAMGAGSLPSALLFCYAITAAAPTPIERSA
ncbi:MAG: hypothetical protein ABEH58_00965 [Haloplanus sp.]